jgi:teichuronic acid biosynthesis glycosyltransferase TuaC
MRILHLSSVYPSQTAPTRGTYSRDLCRALQQNCDVRVLSPVSWLEALTTPGSRTAETHDPVPSSRPIYWYPPRVQRHRYGEWMWRSIRRHVEQVVSDFQPDWVISYWAHPDGEVALRAARSCGARAAVSIGGSDVLLLTENAKRRKVISKVLQDIDLVFTVCDGLRDRVIELGGSPDRTHTSYQGIDLDTFTPGNQSEARQSLGLDPTAPLFLWVGRIVAIKRLDVLLPAFQIVREHLPDAQLALVGSGPQSESMRSYVHLHRLSDAVRFVGPVDRAGLPNWYRAADATVLSSDSEGLPNVLRESLACGTPFVSTDAGSIREIAADEYSRVVRCGDVDALQRAMLQILDSSYRDGVMTYQPQSWSATAEQRLQLMREFDTRQKVTASADSRPLTPEEAAAAKQ